MEKNGLQYGRTTPHHTLGISLSSVQQQAAAQQKSIRAEQQQQ
jgi:hypothetical protein